MQQINTFVRNSWQEILGMGNIVEVIAVGTHYIEVVYDKIKPNGFQFMKDFPDSVSKNLLMDRTHFGFSVNWSVGLSDMEKIMRDKVLSVESNVYAGSTLHKKGLPILHMIMMCKPDDVKYDGKRGSYLLTDGYSEYVVYMDTPKRWVDILVDVQNNYRIKLNNNRVNWFNWLKDAAYAPRTDGCVYKFPNGLSVKMDNGKLAILECGTPIYCETWDATSDITRHNSEADFMVWLTKYF